MTLLISQEDVEQILSIESAIPVIDEAFQMAGKGDAENPARFRMPIEEGFLRFGPAALHAKRVVGFKVWANFGSGPANGWNFVFGMDTGELLAIVHSYTIGTFRTAAASAVAVKYLSPGNAGTIGIYGTGRHAEKQLQAICAVRPIRKVLAYSRTAANRELFCREMSKRLGIEVAPASTPEEVARDADIIVTMTTSETPVLKGEWLVRPGLIVAAGANEWHKREIDEHVVRKADLVVVDEKEQAKVESGDLMYATSHGIINWDRIEELGKVMVGRVPVPDFAKSIILFESHGLATEDVAISAKAYELAKARGLGRDFNFALGKGRALHTKLGAA